MPEYLMPENQESLAGVQFVFLMVSPETLDEWVDTLNQWFGGRDEVSITDYGTTDKQELGFVVLEWRGYTVDKLFVAILEEDDDVEDYTVYTRSEEGD